MAAVLAALDGADDITSAEVFAQGLAAQDSQRLKLWPAVSSSSTNWYWPECTSEVLSHVTFTEIESPGFTLNSTVCGCGYVSHQAS